MQELDDVWSKMLAEAAEKARLSGRADVADYLGLKASNDLIRIAGVQWLFDTLIQDAASANRERTVITIERNDPHSFSYRGANLVGSSVSFRYGVRCLKVEAGWTRTPTDGFMRGGGLAFARLKHFGMPKDGVDLVLKLANETPVWRTLIDETVSGEIGAVHLIEHIRLLTER